MSHVLRPQFQSDETLLGGETSVTAHLLLAGCLRRQHADGRLQKGTRVLRPGCDPERRSTDELFLCQRYHSLAENFLKGQQPAVVRSRAAGHQNGDTDAIGQFAKDRFVFHSAELEIRFQHPVLSAEFPVPQVDVHRSEEEEEDVDRGTAGPPHGTYVIPVQDITIETNPGSALDAGRCGLSRVNLQPHSR